MVYPTLCLFYKRHTDGTIVGDFDNKITVRFICGKERVLNTVMKYFLQFYNIETMTQIAMKFVQWDVPELEKLKDSKVYKLRERLDNGDKLSREEKNWLTRNVKEC